MPDTKHLLLVAPLALAAALHAGDSPPVSSFDDALARGHLSLDTRVRWEYADQPNLKASDAFTARTAFGFTSAVVDGFQVMAEAENITSLGASDRYNAAGTNAGGAGRTVIADPPGTALNQAWLDYAAYGAALKAGRQRLVFDNARFVGDSGWRQNMQTFDAAALTVPLAPAFSLTYAYSWRVSRVFGNQAPQPDFTGDLHLVNAAFTGWKAGRLAAYAYLLDFDNSAANSSDTCGASFTGAAPVGSAFTVNYRLEYATQQDAGRNPLHYRADYYAAELGAGTKGVNLTAGWEVLGSDGGRKGFATPLATLHAFNGWADLFLATPARGLRDAYVSAGVTFAGGFPAKVVFHDFASAIDGADYGREWDALVSHQIGNHWNVLAKLARHEAGGPYVDTTRFWLQCEYSL
ncbi:MAG TPA: alginate export family protein [Lacunisphaera sp.]|nr:alginate export family protein [Lacunisphaera sp.]